MSSKAVCIFTYRSRFRVPYHCNKGHIHTSVKFSCQFTF